MTLPPGFYLAVADAQHQEIHQQLLSLVHLLRDMHSAISSEGQGSLNSPKAAHWSDSEVDALVNYLHIHHAK